MTDRLERNNDFCNDCHLPSGVPLHIEIRRDFDAAGPATLSAVHGRAWIRSARGPAPSAAGSDAAGRAFRCVDCHGGTSLLGRLRVKVLAAKDAFWYVTGQFEEPTSMRWPLWDEDCRKCHDAFDVSDVAPWQSPRFHQLPVHNVKLGVRCVECHAVHDAGGNPDAYFVHAPLVRGQCARCHSEFEEGAG